MVTLMIQGKRRILPKYEDIINNLNEVEVRKVEIKKKKFRAFAIDEDLWREVKEYCGKRGLKMYAFVENAIWEKLDKERTEKDRRSKK